MSKIFFKTLFFLRNNFYTCISKQEQNTKTMKNHKTPNNIILIPKTSDFNTFEINQNRAYDKGLESCPCCGRGIKNETYFINSIYGGEAYPSEDKNEYEDAWQMVVGSECRKLFPKGYVFKK